MNNAIEQVVEANVTEEIIPEVVEQAVKFNAKDAGVIGTLIVGGGFALYGIYKLTTEKIVPKFKKNKPVDDIEEFLDDEATETEDEKEFIKKIK